jgi:hypothetical protein
VHQEIKRQQMATGIDIKNNHQVVIKMKRNPMIRADQTAEEI